MSVKIALDAGHGLRTAGKQTPDGIKEWTLNDKVRDKVVEYLSYYDCKIINTDNDEGYTDESLGSRKATYINAGADAFVSIHHDALTGTWNNATGVTVYIDKNSTEEDLLLAKCIYDRLVKYSGLKGRGIKRMNFAVINQNKVPAVLVEGGFMDGKIDYPKITSDEGQAAYARAVAEGLIEFLNLHKGEKYMKELEALKKRVSELEAKAKVYDSLNDMPEWIKNITEWGLDNGIISGTGTGLGMTITKAETLVMVKNAAKKK